MYLSMPLLCSGCRNERNSSSFSSWSAGGLSAWNQRSFKLSRTSWAVVKPYFIHIIRNGFVTSTTPYLTNASSTLQLTFFIQFQFFIVFYLLSHFFSLKPLLAKTSHGIHPKLHVLRERNLRNWQSRSLLSVMKSSWHMSKTIYIWFCSSKTQETFITTNHV